MLRGEDMVDIKWIKLSVNMFDDEKIKLIRTMPEGDSIALIWVQILCLAGKINDGGLVYMGQNLAYSDEMLATILGHPVNTMRLALNTLEQFSMIDVSNDGFLGVTNWEKHQSTDKMARIANQNRERQQRYTYRNKLRELGFDVDAKGFTDNIDELKALLDGVKGDEKTNVSITSPNALEVRSKKKEVRSKKKEVNSQQSTIRGYDDDSDYIKLSKHLFGYIKQRNPKQKEPNWQLWANDMRKLVEIDNKEVNVVGAVIDWCQNDEFWQNNILSPAKLRKQFDQLYLKMNQKPKPFRRGNQYKESIPVALQNNIEIINGPSQETSQDEVSEAEVEAIRARINELIGD